MAKPPLPTRTQVMRGPARPASGGWTELTVITRDSSGLLESEAVLRAKDDTGYLDLALTEYSGVSRRAKLTSARLDEPAARALFEMLAAKFQPGRRVFQPQQPGGSAHPTESHSQPASAK